MIAIEAGVAVRRQPKYPHVVTCSPTSAGRKDDLAKLAVPFNRLQRGRNEASHPRSSLAHSTSRPRRPSHHDLLLPQPPRPRRRPPPSRVRSPPVLPLPSPIALTKDGSAYSAHEHSALQALSAAAAISASTAPQSSSPAARPLTTASGPLAALPPDIALEALAAVALLGAALVLGAEPLRPVRWAEWAAGEEAARRRWKAGRGLGDGERDAVGLGLRGYEWLEPGCRRGFLDIRVSLNPTRAWLEDLGCFGGAPTLMVCVL